MSTLYVGRGRSAMCEVFKAVNDTGPQYAKKYFTLNHHVYKTRALMLLVVSKFIWQEKS